MRGADRQQAHLFSYVSPERRVPADHPLRPIRAMVDAAFTRLSPRFEALYSHTGRPSVPPEKLLRALLLQVFYSVRSEALLMEQLDYNLLFRWFVGLNIQRPSFMNPQPADRSTGVAPSHVPTGFLVLSGFHLRVLRFSGAC
jgi:transposase